MAADDDIPKCSLPPKRAGTKPRPRKRAPAKKKPPAVKRPPPKKKPPAEKKPLIDKPEVVPAWDAKAEAAAARDAVSKRATKATVPLDPKIERSGEKDPRYARKGATPKPTKAERKAAAVEAKAEVVASRDKLAETLLSEIRKPDDGKIDDALFSDICQLIANGITLRQICRRTDMPSRSALYKFMEDETDPVLHRGRLARYARARMLGFDDIAEEALEIADDGTNDYVEREKDGETEVVLDREHIQRSKLRFDARMKLLSVWDPKRYGDRLALSDPDGAALGTGAARERSVSDMAIGLAKIMEAAKREDPALEDGSTIEGEAR